MGGRVGERAGAALPQQIVHSFFHHAIALALPGRAAPFTMREGRLT
jgi:hypothetical protein